MEDYQPCPDPRCNDHLGASPMPQCVTAVYWTEEAQKIADVLRELSDRSNGIDCGSCKVCHRHRLYDTRGNVGPCSNPECLSHRIGEILDRYKPTPPEVLERIRKNCERAIRNVSPATTVAPVEQPEAKPQHSPTLNRATVNAIQAAAQEVIDIAYRDRGQVPHRDTIAAIFSKRFSAPLAETEDEATQANVEKCFTETRETREG